ncbi:hypothetical protein JCM10212_001491 [Sporobolomyces blumeae]
MSSFVPSTLRAPHPSATPAYYTDCQACRVTGTATFSLVGLYALLVSRRQATSQLGKASASLFGLGFLAVAAARWTSYTPPPSSESGSSPAPSS